MGREKNNKAVETPPPNPTEIVAAAADSGVTCQRIVDSIQEGIVLYDSQLRCRLWNPFMEKVTGHPASAVLGKKPAEMHPFLKEHGIDVLLERALKGYSGFINDTAYSQKRTNWSGYLAGNVIPLRDSKGEVTGVLGIIHDTTRRRRMGEAMAAQEHRFRELFENNPQPMWVHDVETLAMLAVNDAALRQYGYTQEEFLFLTMNELLAPSDLAGAPKRAGAIRDSVDESRLWQHRTKSGKIIDVEMHSHVVSFARRRALLVVADDVTERRKALQGLRENELKYRTLIEAADVAIFLSEADSGRILEANRRAETLLGLSRHQLAGLTLSELHPPEMAVDRLATPASRRSSGGQATQAYVWHRAGRRIPVDIISTTMEVGGRKLVQSIYRDITIRKRAEEALASRTNQLEILARATRQFNSVLEIPVILRTLCRAGQELIHATGAMVGLVVEGKIKIAEYVAGETTVPVNYQFGPGQGVAGYVLASQLTYSSNDPINDPLVIPEVQQAFNVRNLVNVPILSRNGLLLGCLEVHNTENQRTIEAPDLTMLEVLAAGAAVAIENARILEDRRRTENRYRNLAENVVDLIWSVDFDLRFVDLTPSSETLLGWKPEEMVGRPIFDFLAPESAAMVRQAVSRGLKRESFSPRNRSWSKLIEVEQMRKDGSRVWVEAKVQPVFDEAGRMVGFAGVTRDISERRRAQAERDRLLATYTATLESIPQGFLIVDTHGKMSGFNQRFVQMWRIPQAIADSRQDEKALQWVLDQLKDPQGFKRKVDLLYSTPEAESHDFIEFKDGRLIERYSSPLRVAGEVIGRVWSFRDTAPQP